MNTKTKTGTREWSDVSHNIGIGCSHGCLYCYAAAYAVEKGTVCDREDWMVERLTPRRIPTKEGIIMFPTAHDITPYYLDASLAAIEAMVRAGRQVLIVTKAHLECVEAICNQFGNYKKFMEFRITIGSMDEDFSRFWEPGAPSPQERLEALRHAFLKLFKTSVSIEPMLGNIYQTCEVVYQVDPYVSEHIWIGKMNSLIKRLDMPEEHKDNFIEALGEAQSDENIMKLYDALKHDTKIKWKDSIQSVVTRNQK